MHPVRPVVVITCARKSGEQDLARLLLPQLKTEWYPEKVTSPSVLFNHNPSTARREFILQYLQDKGFHVILLSIILPKWEFLSAQLQRTAERFIRDYRPTSGRGELVIRTATGRDARARAQDLISQHGTFGPYRRWKSHTNPKEPPLFEEGRSTGFPKRI